MARCFAFAVAAACVTSTGFVEPASAQISPTEPPEIELRRQLNEVLGREAEARKRIDALERRLESLEASAGLPSHGILSDEQGAQIRGRGAVSGLATQSLADGSVAIIGQSTGEATVASVQADEGAEEDRKAPAPSASVELITEQEQGIFGDDFSIEAGLTYTHFDAAQLNLSGFLALDSIFLGLISLDQIVSDVFVGDLALRYGLNDRLQFDVNIPYLYRHSNFQSGGAGGDAAGLKEADVSDHGLGDIHFGASYRLFEETLQDPDVVLNARVKAPTGKHPWGVELVEVEGTLGNLKVPERLSMGSGVWSASIGLSMLKTIDPMVVFGSLTYFHNFRKDFKDLDEAEFDQPGSAKIGDALQFGAGVAYALNDRSSLSMSFTQRVVERTVLYRDCDGCGKETVVGSQANVGSVNLGADFALSDRLAIITNIGIGTTQDAPDMTFSLRVPYRF